jgi:hypothetical protein
MRADMTDQSFVAIRTASSASLRRSPFNALSIVAMSAGLWAAASATLSWAGMSPGWALGLGYLASPVLTLAVMGFACVISDLLARRARNARRGFERLARDVAMAEAVAKWDADCAAERAEGRASDRAA